MTDQISPEELQKRNLLLKTAKQMLIQDYATLRTQQHQQWIKDSETSWKTNGVLLAYPPAKLYPTEQEIVNKALELYNQSLPTNNEIKLQNQVAEIYNEPITIVPEVVDTSKPIENTENTEPLSSTVTEQLKSVYKKEPIMPNIFVQMLTTPTDKYIESLISKKENTDIKETTVDEDKESDNETNETPIETITPVENIVDEAQPKHSLLRSVLSGWLSKNKDKDK